MAERASCVFVTMPTSGTGSLWRLITAIGGNDYKPVKIAEEFENKGEGSKIPTWMPDPVGHLYMYNTPHFVNRNFDDPAVRLITNFRDPRALACNQFHWALQHPMANRSGVWDALHRELPRHLRAADWIDWNRACMNSASLAAKRMARPVGKQFPRSEVGSLRQHIRSQQNLAKMGIRASHA